MMMEGEKAFIYKVSKDNVANKTEIKIGTRQESKIEVLFFFKTNWKMVSRNDITFYF